MCKHTQAPTHLHHTLLAQVKQGKLKAAEAQDRMRRAIVGHVKAYWHILHRHGRGPNTVHVSVDVCVQIQSCTNYTFMQPTRSRAKHGTRERGCDVYTAAA